MDPSSPRRSAGRDGAEPDRLSNAGREGSGKRSYVRFVPRIAGGRADLEEAIRRDPNFGPAHAYLAWLNLIDICWG